MAKRILFSGYFGFGNAGDEAVLAAALAQFRGLRPDLEFCVASGSPAATRRDHRVRAFNRYSPLATLAALRNCDLFISGGGSLLQDRTSTRSLSFYLFQMKLARWLKKPVMIFAQGIGPLDRPESRVQVAAALKEAAAITVRDAESAELLRSMGVGESGGPEVEVTADMAFALKPEVTQRISDLALERPVVAVALRPWPGAERLIEPVGEALASLEGEARFQGWALQPDQDLPVMKSLAARVPGMTLVEQPLQPEEWAALAGWSDVVLAMRLHALIFGLARATPALGIAYDPKVESLLTRMRSRPVGDASGVDAAALCVALRGALSEPESRRQDRAARAEHLAALAGRNVERALELLGSK